MLFLSHAFVQGSNKARVPIKLPNSFYIHSTQFNYLWPHAYNVDTKYMSLALPWVKPHLHLHICNLTCVISIQFLWFIVYECNKIRKGISNLCVSLYCVFTQSECAIALLEILIQCRFQVYSILLRDWFSFPAMTQTFFAFMYAWQSCTQTLQPLYKTHGYKLQN